MTPSLLPRGPLFQGLVSGAAGAIGYGLGVFAVWLVRYMRSKDSSPPAPRWAWLALLAIGIVGTIAMVIWFHVWQDDVRDLMGVPRLKWHDYPLAAVLALVVLFVLVEIGQLVGKLIRFLVRQLNRVAPPRVSAVVAVVLLLALAIALLNGVVVQIHHEGAEQHVRHGERRNGSRHPGADHTAAVRRTRVSRSAGRRWGIRAASSWIAP